MLASATGLITMEGDNVPGSFNAPLLSMENAEMVLFAVLLGLPLATNRKPPELSVATYEGQAPAANGEPFSGVRAPELSMENAETLPPTQLTPPTVEPWLAVYRNFPEGWTHTFSGVGPVEMGAPTGASCPELPILTAATVLALESARNRNLALESMAIDDGFKPTGVVDAAGVFRIPVVVSKVYVKTEPAPVVEVATNNMFPVVASPVGDAGAMDSGQDPAVFGMQAFGMGGAAGGYLTSVSVPPIWSIMNSEMLSDPWLATNT